MGYVLDIAGISQRERESEVIAPKRRRELGTVGRVDERVCVQVSLEVDSRLWNLRTAYLL